MKASSSRNKQEQLVAELNRLWKDEQDHVLFASTIRVLDARYDLNRKTAKAPDVEDIITQMFGRLENSIHKLSNIRNKKVLDIACGSNTSKAPLALFIDTPFGKKTIDRRSKGYTAPFEPWFCRILFALGENPVGVA